MYTSIADNFCRKWEGHTMNCSQCLHNDVCGRKAHLRVEKSDPLYHRIETVCLSFTDTPRPQGDLVRVVRCRTCKNYDPKKVYKHYSTCTRTNRTVAEYDYCSFGEPIER